MNKVILVIYPWGEGMIRTVNGRKGALTMTIAPPKGTKKLTKYRALLAANALGYYQTTEWKKYDAGIQGVYLKR